MQVIILAAGQGSRLLPLTKTIPKPLIEVNKIPLLKYSLEFIRNFFCSEVLIVCGYKNELIREYISKIRNEFPYVIKILTNPKRTTGNIHSLKIALPFVKGDFFLMNADHIYYNSEISCRIKNSIKGKSFFAVCDFDRVLEKDDMKIKTTKDKKEVVKISKRLRNYNGGYTGITFCSKSFFPKYQRLFRLALKNGKEHTVVESVLQLAADKKIYPKICDISNLGWLEIDTLANLTQAERFLKKLKYN